jgi:hypothetical protein
MTVVGRIRWRTVSPSRDAICTRAIISFHFFHPCRALRRSTVSCLSIPVRPAAVHGLLSSAPRTMRGWRAPGGCRAGSPRLGAPVRRPPWRLLALRAALDSGAGSSRCSASCPPSEYRGCRPVAEPPRGAAPQPFPAKPRPAHCRHRWPGRPGRPAFRGSGPRPRNRALWRRRPAFDRRLAGYGPPVGLDREPIPASATPLLRLKTPPETPLVEQGEAVLWRKRQRKLADAAPTFCAWKTSTRSTR